jgi:hypothetical protein
MQQHLKAAVEDVCTALSSYVDTVSTGRDDPLVVMAAIDAVKRAQSALGEQLIDEFGWGDPFASERAVVQPGAPASSPGFALSFRADVRVADMKKFRKYIASRRELNRSDGTPTGLLSVLLEADGFKAVAYQAFGIEDCGDTWRVDPVSRTIWDRAPAERQNLIPPPD